MADKADKSSATTPATQTKPASGSGGQGNTSRSWFQGEVDQRLAREFVRLKHAGKLKD